MSDVKIQDRIHSYITAAGITASRFFQMAGIERFRGYDILNGARLRDTDELLRLAITLNASPDDTQSMLNEAGFPMLTSGDGRDSAILFALKQGGDIDGLNEALSELGYDRIR